MNKAILKFYAPQARKDFIAAVTARANQLGLSLKAGSLEVAPAQTQGDVTVIGGQAWPSKVSGQRDKLIERIHKDGFEHAMEAVAYTWFNRFAALRYMELHDYLGHGHRALSSTAGGLPDILTHATDLSNDLPGLSAAKVTELKLAGNRDGELYRMLLVAQCNALSRTMPFLFERIDDDSELLLPDNLLRSDSVIAKLVAEIPEEDWAEVEIIGWLYQFYITEKKDQVIGKVVKSEDIPAATQLFTPNWIVQYLVQNSVGRLWLMANPQSTLAKEWPYYITPAEQTPEVQAQLDAIVQTRVSSDGDTLNPESITVLDPACGSGHILVVAYDVLKAIYLERGYQPKTIPRLILEKNLYGVDIDDRAAQMAGFALLMKARADDRRILSSAGHSNDYQSIKLNIVALQDSKELDAEEISKHLNSFHIQSTTVFELIETFKHADNFGSLIDISTNIQAQLTEISVALEKASISGDMYARSAASDFLPIVQQAQIISMKFDALVANPPYIAAKAMNSQLKGYVERNFSEGKGDLFAAFFVRGKSFLKKGGSICFMTPFTWMFLSSYEAFRNFLLRELPLTSLVHPEYHSIWESAAVPICAFCAQRVEDYVGSAAFIGLSDVVGPEKQADLLLNNSKVLSWTRRFDVKLPDLSLIPGAPIAYWISNKVRRAFNDNPKVGTVAIKITKGIFTGENARFIREWHEVPIHDQRWVIYSKGGAFRKWYGNASYKLLWEDGQGQLSKFPGAGLGSSKYFGKPHFVWSKLTSSSISFRYDNDEVFFDDCSPAIIMDKPNYAILSLLNSKVAALMIKLINPTLNYQSGDISKLPILDDLNDSDINQLSINAEKCVAIARDDWNDYETSWAFKFLPFLNKSKLKNAWEDWEKITLDRIEIMRNFEETNNKILINAYGLDNEIQPDVPEAQITLGRAEREKDCQRLISYAIGCIMGRFSLDEPGFIYADSLNSGFKAGRYATFPADADGIVPITDDLWFDDDAPSRIREFLRAVWGPDTLEENIVWLAESLGTKASETPDETIRRYIADKFFKDHLLTYKKRPIYWLFSSGKQRAFQALVYLHRYHEGTLARLRAEYVVPLTGKIQSRVEMLQKDAAAASSTAARNKLAKEVEKLKKKHVELLAYDEQLRHYADMRIPLDLDDGVKVNYGKFGDLLAEVKVITGGASDD
jgi:hypothetical protein